MKYQKMTLNDHLETARDLKMARECIIRAFNRVKEYYPTSSDIMKSFEKILPTKHGTPWGIVKHYLDEDYYQATTEAQRKEFGQKIYYNDNIFTEYLKKQGDK